MVVTAVWAAAFGFSASVGFLGDVLYGRTDNSWTGWILQLGALSSRWPSPVLSRIRQGQEAAHGLHPVPSWSRVFEWLPPFVLATGVAGQVLATVSSGVVADLVVLGAFGTALLRRREPRARAT